MSTDQSADQNGRTAMEFLNAFTSGDVAKAWSFTTDDFRWTLMDKRMGGGEPPTWSCHRFLPHCGARAAQAERAGRSAG